MGSVMFLPMEFGVFAFFEIIDEILKGDDLSEFGVIRCGSELFIQSP